MIYTDRKYNKVQTFTRKERIEQLEKEHDELAELMFDHPVMCTPENINRLNGLASQIEIMKGNKIINF
ncbi:MAG: hypothetical protein LUD46_22495 [Parabacteroides sp.]|nr:hypothetical protein [Parabacteroides sp.]